MKGDGDGDGVVVPLRRTGASPPSAETFSVKDVSDASGLPQPVVAAGAPHRYARGLDVYR
jgi:hypothetical protein